MVRFNAAILFVFQRKSLFCLLTGQVQTSQGQLRPVGGSGGIGSEGDIDGVASGAV